MQLQVLEVLAQRSIFVAAPLGMACIMCLQRSVSTYPYLEVTQSVNMIGFNDLWSLVTHTQQRWGGNWTSCYTHLPVARVCWSVYTSQRQFSPNPFNHTTKGGSTLVAEMNSGNGGVLWAHHWAWCTTALCFRWGQGSYTLHGGIRYSCIYISCMSPTHP